MARKEEKPKIRSCMHCGNRAPMETVAKYNHVIEYGDPPHTDEDYYFWSILLCPSCQKPTLEEIFRSTFEQDMDFWPSHQRILYPAIHSTMEGLPEIIKRNYEAALRVKNVEPNAFAVSIGRTLEAICKDRKASGKDLFEKLKDLGERNEIPGRLSDMAQKLRLLRNVGAHSDLGEIEEEDVPVLVDFCEAILEYIYRAPARIELVQKRIDSLKEKAKA
jgi:hypothetical protein